MFVLMSNKVENQVLFRGETKKFIKDNVDKFFPQYRDNEIREIDDTEDGYDGNIYIKGYAPVAPEPNQEQLNIQEINQLKAELAAEDYKITKCYEANLANEPLPYDFTQLHAERQSKRDRINLLEETLNHE